MTEVQKMMEFEEMFSNKLLTANEIFYRLETVKSIIEDNKKEIEFLRQPGSIFGRKKRLQRASELEGITNKLRDEWDDAVMVLTRLDEELKNMEPYLGDRILLYGTVRLWDKYKKTDDNNQDI